LTVSRSTRLLVESSYSVQGPIQTVVDPGLIINLMFESKLYDRTAPWRAKSVTEGQIARLRELGISSPRTRGEAADVIAEHRSPSEDEIEFLLISVYANWTLGEANFAALSGRQVLRGFLYGHECRAASREPVTMVIG